ncbi:MAG: tetraacyldisaccharide 4'-kinase [Flavobacteriaceae bacterium]|nr:tetraacyldisaccharide 4'-kinase [Flavobacteriaceae bacterium]
MKYFRFLGFPFAILYGFVTAMRNYMYDKGWLKSTEYEIPVICVGNLSVGGTGKSPMISYLVTLLKDEYKVAVLSRGYKRKTRGYLEVKVDHTAREVGDEPLQFKQNFSNITVAVCADRRTGIEKLKSKADLILLDDAFQHRKVKAKVNILLTPWDDLYIDDYLLPMGMLREPITGVARADIVVVTKCPDGFPYAKQQEIQLRLNLKPHQKLYFSKVAYDNMIYGKSENLPLKYLIDKPFTLVTGIANPEPLVEYLKKHGYRFTHEKYPDHHDFTDSDINKLSKQEIILTTEKDYMRLQPHIDKFALYYLPIKTIILNEQHSYFKERIEKALQ